MTKGKKKVPEKVMRRKKVPETVMRAKGPELKTKISSKISSEMASWSVVEITQVDKTPLETTMEMQLAPRTTMENLQARADCTFLH